MTLAKKIEEWIVDTEEEAETLIAQAKENANEEGYELKGYQTTKKEKKSTEEEWYVVKLTKVW